MRLSLTLSLEEIRRRFSQKWRNCLNHAERHGISVKASDSHELLEGFCRLHGDLEKRKGFSAELDAVFYSRVQACLPASERFHVSMAECDGVPVAVHFSSMIGETCCYLRGAANEVGRRVMASYLLQWQVIRTARERGCRWYDLGGIDPDANPGVYHFKKGLGGIDVTVPGPFELRPGGMKGHVTLAAEGLYRLFAS